MYDENVAPSFPKVDYGTVAPDDGQYDNPGKAIVEEGLNDYPDDSAWEPKPGTPEHQNEQIRLGMERKRARLAWPKPETTQYMMGRLVITADIDLMAAATSDEHREAAQQAASDPGYFEILGRLIRARLVDAAYEAVKCEVPSSAIRGVLVQ